MSLVIYIYLYTYHITHIDLTHMSVYRRREVWGPCGDYPVTPAILHTVVPSWYNRPGYVRTMADLVLAQYRSFTDQARLAGVDILFRYGTIRPHALHLLYTCSSHAPLTLPPYIPPQCPRRPPAIHPRRRPLPEAHRGVREADHHSRWSIAH